MMAVEGRGSKKCEEAGRQKEETQSMQSHEQFDHCKGKHCARFFLYSVFGFSLVFWRKCGTNQTASNMHPKSIQIPAWNTLLNAALVSRLFVVSSRPVRLLSYPVATTAPSAFLLLVCLFPVILAGYPSGTSAV